MRVEDIRDILIKNRGVWLLGTHQGNDGNQGNTLETLLGVKENNLKIPDLGEIELKSQKAETKSLLTLFHRDPNPSASVPKLLKCLGWKHKQAGEKYPSTEMSFRSTTYAHRTSDRGFSIDFTNEKIVFSFNPDKVNKSARDQSGSFNTYGEWLNDVEKRVPHYSKVLPVFWNIEDLEDVFINKLDHTLMCFVETKRDKGIDFFAIKEAYIYKTFLRDKLKDLFHRGSLVIDFDARTGHNHGTKLRIKREDLGVLFDYSSRLV